MSDIPDDSQRNLAKEIGKTLRVARIEKGYTTRQMSALTGASMKHQGNIEGGDRLPSAALLGRYSRALGIDLSDYIIQMLGRLSQIRFPLSVEDEDARTFVLMHLYLNDVINDDLPDEFWSRLSQAIEAYDDVEGE